MNGAQLATPADNLRARMAMPIAGQPQHKWQTQLVSGSLYINAKLSAGWCILPSNDNRILPQWLGAILLDTDPGDEQPEPQGIAIDPPRKGRPKGSKNKPK